MINISELYIMPIPGWHDYRPAFSSLNRSRFHWQAESQSDWLRGVLLRPDILQGRQQRQWNNVDETACAKFSGHGDRSLMNIVPKQDTLFVFLCNTTMKNIQHKKTNQ